MAGLYTAPASIKPLQRRRFQQKGHRDRQSASPKSVKRFGEKPHFIRPIHILASPGTTACCAMSCEWTAGRGRERPSNVDGELGLILNQTERALRRFAPKVIGISWE